MNCWRAWWRFLRLRRLTMSVRTGGPGNGTPMRTAGPDNSRALREGGRGNKQRQQRQYSRAWRQRPGEAGDELLEKSLRPLKTRRSAHAGVKMTFRTQKLVAVRHGLLIMDVERHTAEPPARTVRQGIAVMIGASAHRDDAGTGCLICLSRRGRAGPGSTARSAIAARSSRFFQAGSTAARDGLSVRAPALPVPRALVIKHMHVEGAGADGISCRNLPRPMMPMGRTVERAGAPRRHSCRRRVLPVVRGETRRARS